MKPRMFRRITGMILALLLLLSGCGSSSTTSDSAAVASEASTENMGFVSESAAAEPTPSTPLANTKLIYTADLSAETTQFEQAVQDIEALAAQLGGYIEHSSTSGTTGDRLASYTLRIPQAQYQAFVDQVGTLCSVTYKQEDIQDISEYYFDRESRLKAQTTKRDRLLTLLEQATEMEDIIALESALAEVQTEIESLTGELRKYDSLVDFSTITLSLSEVRTLSAVAADPSFLSELKLAFVNGSHGFVGFLQGLLLVLVTAWPVLLIAALAAFVCVRLLRRRRAKDEAAQRALLDRIKHASKDDPPSNEDK